MQYCDFSLAFSSCLVGNYQLGIVENRNKKSSSHELWNYFYSYPGMRNTRDAHKAKAIAHMNEQEDIHIKCDTAIFLFCSLLFSSWLVGNYQLGMVENRNKKYSSHELWNYFYSYLGMRNTRDAHKLNAIACVGNYQP